jgi:two-component system response regulator AtoC
MKILLAEKDHDLRGRAARHLAREGFEVIEAQDGLAAAAGVAREGVGLLLLDLELDGMDGPTFIAKIRQAATQLPIAILANGTPPERVALAMAAGASLCIPKATLLEDLVGHVKELLSIPLKERESTPKAGQLCGLDRLVGCSPAIRKIAGLAQQIALSDSSTVLIHGESGTGKDLIAKIIHEVSARALKRFLDVMCTSLPETLLESELFGHERGAFTDAKCKKIGLMELADGGTIFMNEIGDMSPLVQAKVLRALEDKTFRRLGGTEDLRANLRVIAATNRDLKSLVVHKQFREDLYYRLNVLEIEIPPLRERKEDIQPLLKHFLLRYAHEFRKLPSEAPPELLSRLMSYSWPGNVRELRSAVERTVALSQGERVDFEHLREKLAQAAQTPVANRERESLLLKDALAKPERAHILKVLAMADFSQRRAAEIMGINRSTLSAKIVEHDISLPYGASLRV